ncbi:MAG: sigma 54-interacting transcriptional regulator [Bryobacterales bacterium]|nr:sigma 54-interacting transcriptional regulator [Bryobacterales bacterium]
MPDTRFRLDDLVRHASDALLAIDADCRVLSMNPSAELLTGLSASQAVGKPCCDVIQSDLCGSSECPFQRAFEGEEHITTFDTRIRSRNGDAIPVCINTSVLKNERGEKIGVVESIRDIRHILRLIAQREAAGAEAERNAAHLEAVLESSGDAVIAVDLDCRITHFNRAAEELMGYPRVEVMGIHSREICKSEFCPLEVTLDNQEGLVGSELNLRVRDGSAIPVWLRTELPRDRNFSIIGAVAILRDQREVKELRQSLRETRRLDRLVGKSARMLAVYNLIERLAVTESTVLITGESGTGKELVADILHARSARWDKPFVKVNCAALPETLLESELFGHVRGAFTGAVSDRPGRFQLAHTGTIFLDEIGDLPLPLQVKLLRVLQQRTFEPLGSSRTVRVDLRILAATNQDLAQLVSVGRFREDLYYRLHVVPVELPPLRDHPEDIPLLCEDILLRLAKQDPERRKQLTPPAMRMLLENGWPGNVRELENALECAVISSLDGWIRCRDLPVRLQNHERLAGGGRLADTVERSEKAALLSALQNSHTSEDAARKLGISRATLWRKMKRLGVSPVKQWSHH